ncbi:AbiJ-NTD4 domain-containing protein [Methylophilus sp. 13]|uniref:AbiJ-NTD4 domain-containing protein n=1 Tax=Methylophilus sp. 13 TaxID=2781018 RepID=UPI001E479D52|nr:hypothetical protein [Methylophilus sp. 13]
MTMSFSERKGLKPRPEVIQIETMNNALRNSLWNVLDMMLWSTKNFTSADSYRVAGIKPFSRFLWANYFKLPVDKRPQHGYEILEAIRNYYFKASWNEVYDFIEFVANFTVRLNSHIYEALNGILERELSAYRFVNGQLTDITSEQEVRLLDEALADTQFTGVTMHLQRALELYADRVNPDYRNSIKESISAVESMAKILTGNNKAMLSDALKALEKNGQLHRALKDGFEKLYAYTSDADGIRHAMLAEDNLTQADARYFLLSCTSFVNYLKSKM